jgi:hypothetical protein
MLDQANILIDNWVMDRTWRRVRLEYQADRESRYERIFSNER